MKMSRRERRLYERHLKELQKEDPEIVGILDVTEEQANWMKQKRTPLFTEEDFE